MGKEAGVPVGILSESPVEAFLKAIFSGENLHRLGHILNIQNGRILILC